jgi:hypothetical protein
LKFQSLKGECMLRISAFFCAFFVLVASSALPLAAQQSGNPAPPPVSGTGTPNHITKWISTTKLGDSGIFETASGDVGIGTTTPVVPFDLKGKGDVRDTLTLFPSGTHPTLSISGTAFKVSSAGKVTFVAGQTFPGTGTVTSVGSGAGLTGGPITGSGTLSIKNAGVTNAMLAHSSLTVKAGTGMSGGGSVALGNTVTLNNAGVIGLGVAAGLTSTGGQSPTLGIDTSVVPELALSNVFAAPQFVDGYLDAFNGDAIASYAFNTSTVSDHPALYVENDDSTDPGDLALDIQGPSFGGECSVDVTGNLFCTGSLGGAVKAGNNKKTGLYSVQSSESWVEDFGSGQLVAGLTVVHLEPHFAQTVAHDANYHVFLTPAGECEGLFVTNRTANSFEVREMKSGQSNVAFDYRIVVHRKGFESSRLPDISRKFINRPARPHPATLVQR